MSITDNGVQQGANGARKTTDAIKGVIDDVINHGGEKAKHALSRSQERLNHAMDVAGEGADKAQAFISRQMHERPVATAATALGAGLLIGLLLSRR